MEEKLAETPPNSSNRLVGVILMNHPGGVEPRANRHEDMADRRIHTNGMSKIEGTVVGVFLAGICPLLTFVACWWTAVLVLWRVPGMSVNVVIAAALSGLVVGIVLDLLLLRRWMGKFYTANLWLMAAVYVALCVVAVAFFMGLPVGTFTLGLFAGGYAGRRQHYALAEETAARRSLRQVALFASLMTAGAALVIGLLVLRERSVVELLSKILGCEPSAVQGALGVMVIGLLTIVLFGLQYGGSLWAGWMAFRMGGDITNS
jgi:hypothetical protein